MELAHLNPCLWKTMGKSLAEPSGRLQGQDSSTAIADPSTSTPTVHAFAPQPMKNGDGARESAQVRGRARVKLLAKFVRGHKPRSADPY